MKIGELSKKTGCKVVTIRYYEKEGLLGAPSRTEGNYRQYSAADEERLAFIVHCRKHGIKLPEIKALLAFREQPQKDCTWVSALLEDHLRAVNEQIASLEHLKHHLQQLRQSCTGTHDGKQCGILQCLTEQSICCASCAHHPLRAPSCIPNTREGQ